MRLVALLVLGALLVGCELLMVGSGTAGAPGTVVVHGRTNGLEWVVSVERRGEEACLWATMEGGGGGGCQELPRGHLAGYGAGGTRNVQVVNGLVGMEVSRVRIETSAGVQVVEAVDLAELGINARVFAAGFPSTAQVLFLEALDDAGVVLQHEEALP